MYPIKANQKISKLVDKASQKSSGEQASLTINRVIVSRVFFALEPKDRYKPFSTPLLPTD